MRFWIDTEFNEFGGELISLALIGEDHSEFYEVLDCPNPGNWVAANVMPILGKAPIEKTVFKVRLMNFMLRYQHMHIIADWPDDIRYFCEALIVGPGMALNTPNITFELARWIESQSQLPHNAMSDAKANKIAYLEKENAA